MLDFLNWELAGELLSVFTLNLIPFMGPSNFFIAANLAILSQADPLVIGFIVAFGAASAKTIHYFTMFFLRKAIAEKRRASIERFGRKFTNFSALAIFIVAATPIPDEPVILPLGLMRYSPVRFYGMYFLGKFSIAVPGAYLGRLGQLTFGPIMGEVPLMVLSVVLTIIITVAMFKLDFDQISRRLKPKLLEIFDIRRY